MSNERGRPSKTKRRMEGVGGHRHQLPEHRLPQAGLEAMVRYYASGLAQPGDTMYNRIIKRLETTS
jgi:hypothetical protein